MSRAVVGMANPNLESDLRSVLDEVQGIEVVAVAEDTMQLAEFVSRFEPDLVFVHDALGPEPIVAVIRDLQVRRPGAAVVQLSPERSPQTVIRALEAGARAVIAYPFAFEDFQARVTDALDWATQMQTILEGAAAAVQRGRGQIVAVVGAKGGVGTTTVATHLAIDHFNQNKGLRVCLVDLDVEKGDVSALLDVRQSASIADLARVYQDLSAGTVSDAVIEHESGIFLMLAPIDVRQTEVVTPEALRAIMALLRREFDLVVIDGGGHVSPTQGAVVELADAVVVVTTPDVLSVRAMRKRMLAWEGLGVRHEAELRVLINKVDKASVFPADAVVKLTTAEVMSTRIPLSPRTIEPGVDERDPLAITDVNWWRLISRIRAELGVGGMPKPQGAPVPLEPPAALVETGATASKKKRRGPRRAKKDAERGAIALEEVGVLPVLLGLVVLLWQVAVIGLGFVYLGHAASVAERTVAVSHDYAMAQKNARDATPEPLASGITVSGNGDTVRVELALPPGTFIPKLETTHTVTEEPR